MFSESLCEEAITAWIFLFRDSCFFATLRVVSILLAVSNGSRVETTNIKGTSPRNNAPKSRPYQKKPMLTLPKTNIAPENGWFFGDYFHFCGPAYFQWRAVSFRECNSPPLDSQRLQERLSSNQLFRGALVRPTLQPFVPEVDRGTTPRQGVKIWEFPGFNGCEFAICCPRFFELYIAWKLTLTLENPNFSSRKYIGHRLKWWDFPLSC